MPIRNPFDRDTSSTATAPPRQRPAARAPKVRKPRNPNRGNDNGGAAADTSQDVLTDAPDLTGISTDPQAWMRGQLANAGYTPSGNRPFDAFLANSVVSPFGEGWDTYAATPGKETGTVADFVATLPFGQAAAAPAAPAGVGVQINQEGNISPAAMSFQDWRAQNGYAGNLGPNQRDRAKKAYDTYLAGLSASPASAAAATPNPNQSPLINQAAYNAYIQRIIDLASPQTRGIYDSGLDRSGTRWAVYP